MKDERILIDKLRVGDRRAFENFYLQTISRVRNLVSKRIDNLQDCEELIQDIYLAFLDSLPLFRGASSLMTFLQSIARHEVADYWRKRYAKKAISFVPFFDQIYQADGLYTTVFLASEIERIYQSLSVDYALVLKLKYEKGYSVVQIAAQLSESVKTIESRLFRARKAFRVAYAKTHTTKS